MSSGSRSSGRGDGKVRYERGATSRQATHKPGARLPGAFGFIPGGMARAAKGSKVRIDVFSCPATFRPQTTPGP
jgi:hypothetical protein